MYLEMYYIDGIAGLGLLPRQLLVVTLASKIICDTLLANRISDYNLAFQPIDLKRIDIS